MKKVGVLIIDDDQDLCENLSKILKLDGYEVDIALGGPQALEKFQRREFDIAVLDIKMPRMDGMQVLKEIRNLHRRVAVIILTAYPELESAISAVKDRELFDYIRKPFSMQGIRDAVAKACRSLGLIPCSVEGLNQKIGESIKKERNSKGFALRQLAQTSGITASMLSQIESGKTAASVKTLYKISRALGVEMSELVRGI